MTAPFRRSSHPDGSSTCVDEATATVRRNEFLVRAATLPGAWTGHKPKWDIPIASVGPRFFLLLIPHTGGHLLANVKLDPEDVVAVWATFGWVESSFHQSKRHWVSIDLTSPNYQVDEATAMVEDSCRLILSFPTRRVYEAVLLADIADSPTHPTQRW